MGADLSTLERAAPRESGPRSAGPRRLEGLWRDIATWGDPLSRGLGTSGELFVARLRLASILLLGLIPLNSVVINARALENWIGLLTAILGLGASLLLLRLAGRADPPWWLGLATSQFDVALVSFGCLGFLLTGYPMIATNSLVQYTIYFLAIAATCLRYDPRVCIAAGGAALLQYGAVVLWVGLTVPQDARRSPVYGEFQWDSQIGRLQLLFVATLLATAIVVRSRSFWMRSMRDRLTGLFNRGFFDESLSRLVEVHGRTREPFAVALADLDHFKSINDRFGHAAGDDALSHVAAGLHDRFRGKDVIARYGGEEFGALLMDVDRATASVRLESWRAALSEDPREPRLTTSIGVAFFPEDGDTPQGLVAAADRRLYAAKRAGRNRLVASDDGA